MSRDNPSSFSSEWKKFFSGLTPYKDLEYFPKYALTYFAWSFLFLVMVLFFVDRVVLEYLETRGLLASVDWRIHTQNAANMMLERNRASNENPVWQSVSYKVDERCPRSKRILVLGDSFVWGHGLANMNHTWWRQLQAELDRKGYDVEVVGAGMCGANTRKELLWARQLLKIYKPDLIIWSYVINDPIEKDKQTNQDLVKHKYREKEDKKDWFDYSPPTFTGPAGFFHMVWPKIVVYLEERRLYNFARANSDEAGYEWSTWELKLLEGRNFEQYKETAREVSSFIGESGVPQFFLMMVFPAQKKFENRLRPVESLFREYRIPYLDLLPQMLQWYKQRFGTVPGVPEFVLGATPVDVHPGPIINHYYAVNTLYEIERNYAQVLSSKTGNADNFHKFKDHQNKNNKNNNAAVPPIPAVSADTAVPFKFNDWAPLSLNLKKIDDTKFSIDYPSPEETIFLMPIRRPYVQLNFEQSVKFKSIEINGSGLKSCSFFLGLEDPATHEYKVGRIEALGEKVGKNLRFEVPQSNFEIADIKMIASFDSTDRKIAFKLLR